MIPSRPIFDVFVSYRHADTDSVRPVVQALRDSGLNVWMDVSQAEDFASIQRAIDYGLANSKALLAWYSVGYPESLACQWELTHAFVAGQEEGDARRRVLLINPEPANAHIHPVELRDALYRATPHAVEEVRAAAAAVARHVLTLNGTLGEIRRRAAPPWFGGVAGAGSNRFFGRLQEMWAIHSGLWSAAVPVITNGERRSIVRLTGMGGSGKSLLAETYAIRFGAAYPAGVFWLRAYGHDMEHVKGNRAPQSLLETQILDICAALGIPTADSMPADIRHRLVARLEDAGAYLWVIDDVPSAMSWNEVQPWLAPTANGRTLITSRNEALSWAGSQVTLEGLDETAAMALLTHARTPVDRQESDEARLLAHDLGGHPLALELAAAAVQKRGFAGFRAELNAATRDALDFAAALVTAQAQQLPHREKANINLSTTLLRSVDALDDSARDVLRVAAQLAPSAIPRRLLVSTLEYADEIDHASAEDTVDLGITAVAAQSLAREVAAASWVVHSLVSRAMRFRDASVARRTQLQHGAVAALASLTDPVTDIMRHGEIADVVEHARALAGAPSEGRDADVNDAHLLDNLYILEMLRGDFSAAERYAQQLFEYNRAHGGDEDPATLACLSYLADVARAKGEFRRALEMSDRIFETRRKILGDTHPDTLTAANDMALAWYGLEQFTIAEPLQRTVLELRRRTFGDDHPATLTALNNLASTLSALGDPSVVDLQRQVVEGRTRAFGRDHPDTLQAMGNLAMMLRGAGDVDGARRLEEDVLARGSTFLDEDHPDQLTALNNLAVTMYEQGDVEGARQALERVIAGRTKVLGKNHPLTQATMTNLALVMGRRSRR